MASNQLTPTTGCAGASKPGSPMNGGASRPVPSTKDVYSALLTGRVPARNDATVTRWAGRSSGRPWSLPITKAPPSRTANSGTTRRAVTPLNVLRPDLFDAADRLRLAGLVNRDMGHRCGFGAAVPMLLH